MVLHWWHHLLVYSVVSCAMLSFCCCIFVCVLFSPHSVEVLFFSPAHSLARSLARPRARARVALRALRCSTRNPGDPGPTHWTPTAPPEAWGTWIHALDLDSATRSLRTWIHALDVFSSTVPEAWGTWIHALDLDSATRSLGNLDPRHKVGYSEVKIVLFLKW